MNCICLDMEGVVTPEIWIEFANEVGISELKRTTRDEPDYHKLMQYRMDILKEHGLHLEQIQQTISRIQPLDGAKEFLDELRTLSQVIIVSDTFEEFAQPLMQKLGWPTLFCNRIETDGDGFLSNVKMRCEKSKLATVRGLQSIGFDTIAFGDSYNDLDMIRASKAGFLFRSTEEIKSANPDIPAYDTYSDLLAAIKKAL